MVKRSYYIGRREALTMDQVIEEFIRGAKLSQGLNEQRVYAAWDEVTGAGTFTLERFFRDGTLTVRLASSMVRTHLWMQRYEIVRNINGWLRRDSLFVKEEGKEEYVKELVLR